MPDSPLIIDDDDRYSRFRLIAWWDQDKLRQAKVLVVGAGALGNEVLKNLALLGVGNVYVIDMDHIESSNLTRSVLFRASDRGQPKAKAAANALDGMNPDTNVIPIVGNVLTDLGLGLFRDVDVVIGCLDNREARLWVNRCCWKVGTPWIDGGIQEISGVTKVFVPPGDACYECAMTEMDYRLINLRYSCPLLRQEDLLAGKVPTAPTISSMIGGLQTQEALKLLHGMPVDAGSAMIYNGLSNQFYQTQFQRREDCLSHETYDETTSLQVNNAQTADDLFAAASKLESVNGEELTLVLDRDLVVSLDCAKCDDSRPILKPLPLVGMQQAQCPNCKETTRPNIVHRITPDSELSGNALSELGIPNQDIIKLQAGSSEHYLELQKT